MSSLTQRAKEKEAPVSLRLDKLEEKMAVFDEKVTSLQDSVSRLNRKVSELEARLHEEVD